jgi:hypothetical protein
MGDFRWDETVILPKSPDQADGAADHDRSPA